MPTEFVKNFFKIIFGHENFILPGTRLNTHNPIISNLFQLISIIRSGIDIQKVNKQFVIKHNAEYCSLLPFLTAEHEKNTVRNCLLTVFAGICSDLQDAVLLFDPVQLALDGSGQEEEEDHRGHGVDQVEGDAAGQLGEEHLPVEVAHKA